ncbi:MAG: 3-phosphoserine/phosphohydroxythreonine transaminase [Xanthomonadales bacterium]|nr:3-phosphoserine/phosphohydroxythreonine transaminase [Xanthomonadales bacterium]MBK7146112.1 3-phosphoserine/phosphohydroxythreonine transaminase [Xanthomonadales bacterium]MCC6561670.1 3-phosphoserine/phosphohydroxythreonine transaminase [Xanthomonadales bacterium]
MSRAFNFSSGPGAIPEPVLTQARDEMLEWSSARASVMEISHRGKHFIALAEQAEADLRALMAIPSNYKVLFLQGGATQHFAQIPMNFAAGASADYIVTGQWGQKAAKEAKPYTNVRVAASSEEDNFFKLPPREHWQLDPNAAYLHITPNETIQGVEIHEVPETGSVPLVADMSSNILSKPVDVSRFGVIYAGAQKNIGASGLVVLIVREDLLARCPASIAGIFNYAAHAKEGSMLNTPNTFGWYLAGLTFQWLQREGGLAEMERRNDEKARRLYDYIDASGFYSNPIEKTARSRMNVPFRLADEALDDAFLKQSEAAGLMALKGHRSVGGMRASIYNAMPMAGVDALIAFMRDFAQRHG